MDPGTITTVAVTLLPLAAKAAWQAATWFGGNYIKTNGNALVADVVIEGAGAVGGKHGGSWGEWLGRKVGWVMAPPIVQTEGIQNGINGLGNAVTKLASYAGEKAVDSYFSQKTSDTTPTLVGALDNSFVGYAHSQESNLDKLLKIKKIEKLDLKNMAKEFKLEKEKWFFEQIKTAHQADTLHTHD